MKLILITDAYHYSSKEKLLNSGIARQVLMKPVKNDRSDP